MDFDPKTEKMSFTPAEWALLGEQPNDDPAQRVKDKSQAVALLVRLIRIQDRGYLEYGTALEDGTADAEMQQRHLQEAQAVGDLGEEIMQKCLDLPPDSGEFNVLEAPFTPGRGPGRLIRPDEAPGENTN